MKKTLRNNAITENTVCRPGVSNLLAECAKFSKKNLEWAAFDQKILSENTEDIGNGK